MGAAGRARMVGKRPLLAALLLAFACFSVRPSEAWARSVTLAWDPNPPEESVTGYTVHYGTVSRSAPGFVEYDSSVDAGGATTLDLALPDPSATYYLAVTAYNQYGLRSDYSEEVAAAGGVADFTIVASSDAGGSIAPSGSVAVPRGGSRAFTISPAAGYRVGDVLVDGRSVGAVTSYTFSNVAAGHTIAVSFAADTFTVAASAGPNGAISPAGSVAVPRGGSRAFTISPAAGYRVADVLVDGRSVGAVTSYAFSNVIAGHTISATFAAQTLTLVATAGPGGTIAPNGSVSVARGGSRAFTISPAAGYRVADVLVDGRSSGAVTSYTFSNVTAGHTISARFAAANTFTLAATAGPNGSISPSGSVSVAQGASQTFTISPAAGYRVADVRVDGVTVGAVASYTFRSVNGGHSISATFATATFTVAATSGAGGTIAPSGSVSVAQGGSRTFTISPAPGYRVADVRVDGASVGPRAAYTFTNVTAPHTISAIFTPALQMAASPTEDEDGSAPPAPPEEPLFRAAVERPVSGATVAALQPTLAVYNPLVFEEPLTYEFQVAEDRALSLLVAAEAGVLPAPGVTSWRVPLPLADGSRYYWRARAVGGEASGPWTGVATFVVDSRGAETALAVESSGFLLAGAENRFEVPAPEPGASPLEVRVPAGAVPHDAIFAAGRVENAPAAAGELSFVGPVYDVAPGGLSFAAPATLALPYTPAALEAAQVEHVRELGVFTYDTETLSWEPVPVLRVDLEAQRLVIEVAHFSMYAVGAAQPGSPGGAAAAPAPESAPGAAASSGSGGGGCFLGSLRGDAAPSPAWPLSLAAVLGACLWRVRRERLTRPSPLPPSSSPP